MKTVCQQEDWTDNLSLTLDADYLHNEFDEENKINSLPDETMVSEKICTRVIILLQHTLELKLYGNKVIMQHKKN